MILWDPFSLTDCRAVYLDTLYLARLCPDHIQLVRLRAGE